MDIDGLHRRAESRLGKPTPTFRFRVEATKVAEFRQALRLPHGTTGVPLTFYESVRLQTPPDCDVMAPLALHMPAVLHGEQEVDVHQELRVGDELDVTSAIESVQRRHGRRAGDMLALTLRTTFQSRSGALKVQARRRVLQLAHQPEAGDPPPESADSWSGRVDLPPLTLADLVRYAGASGDFNPSHYDRDLARASGSSDVFAHGMLGAGLVMEVAREHVSTRALSFGVRFLDRIWPARPLAVVWRPQADSRRYRLHDDRGAKLDVTVRSMAGMHPADRDREEIPC